MQTTARMPERSVERQALASPETVQGDGEVMDTNLGHGDLRSVGCLRYQLVDANANEAPPPVPEEAPSPGERGQVGAV